jgi:hypothetical protein
MKQLEHSASEPIACNAPILSPAGKEMATLLRWDEAPGDSDQVLLHLESGGLILEAQEQRGYFQALCSLRSQLEAGGRLIVCYGAVENVFPSPMIEAMGYGEKAYQLTLGKPALTQDLVSIFDFRDDLIPATVQKQREFYDKWLRSLK